MNKAQHIIILIFVLIFVISCTGHRRHSIVAECDSIYSAAHIQDLSIVHPREALALLDTAEAEKLMTPFDISRLRCLAYHNGLASYRLALVHGLKAYNMPDARNDLELFLNLVELIADEYHNNGDYTESVRYCTEGLEISGHIGDKASEANFHVTFGLNLLEMRRLDEAFRHFHLAVDILEKEADGSSSYVAWDDYIYALGMTINSYCYEKQYDEAISMLPAYRRAIKGLEKCEDIIDGLADMRRASGYAAYAYIYRQKGNVAEADRLYALFEKTRMASVPDGENLRIPYLLSSGRYREALRYVKREKDYWSENADTISYDYVKYHLRRELQAYEGLGDVNSVCRVQNTMLALIDSIRENERHDDALELAEIYKTNEQAVRIKEQENTLRIRSVIIVSSFVLLLIAIVFIIRVMRYNSIVRKKNSAMIQTIDELMSYKDELFVRQEENMRLRNELEQIRRTNLKSDGVLPEMAVDDEAESEEDAVVGEILPEKELTVGDRALYDRINYEIMSRKLYLNPDFNKKELLKEIYVPANKFASLFKTFAGCGFSQYVQNCRLDYAVRMMREHPQWSMEAIAQEAQMSKAAFYKQFQKKYGMNPSSYIEKERLNK